MSLNKEKLLTVNGLNMSAVNEMSDSQFSEYCKELFDFTESFHIHEAELKNSLAAKDYDIFSKAIFTIREVLEKIQAIGLSHSCRRMLEELRAKKYDIAEAHLIYLLAEISALSIDIQTAHNAVEIHDKAEIRGKSDAATESNTRDEKNDKAKRKNILAVDDISLLLRMLKSLLQDTEYNLIGVTSGEEALRYIDKNKPDLFILDIEMPKMNGYELAGKIRSRGQTAPIIFLTGNEDEEDVIKAINAGGADFIVKPVNKDQVLEKIKKHISQ